MASASQNTSFLTGDIEQHQELFGQAFNAGDADAINSMYADHAVGVWEPGFPLTGQARRDYVTDFMSRKPSVEATVLQTLVTGDTAMLIVQWSMETTTKEGKPEHLEGTAVDVLQRDENGHWRYVVDNPYGASGPHTAEEAAAQG